jgi:CTP synthase
MPLSPKPEAVKYARTEKVPFFGICLGMQCAVIEYARNVLNLADAHTTEINPNTSNPVIDLMVNQKKVTDKGGTMRLGAYSCLVEEDSKVFECYQKVNIKERHRHRYEFNNDYKAKLESAGMKTTGLNPESNLVEIIEVAEHPWFVGVQFHPEYKSTVASPQPLFVGFIDAAITYSKQH